MKLSKTLPTLLSSLALLVGAATAKAEAVFQFGFFAPDLQLVDASEDIRGLRIDFVYGENRNVTGLDLGVVNSTTADFAGVGFGPVQLVDGDATAWQPGWFYSHTAGRFTGWQGGFLARIGGAGSLGLQTGAISLAEADFTGVQIGFFNRAESVKGLQFGFVNWAERLDGGLQLGLVNIAENSDLYPVLPFVNWQF